MDITLTPVVNGLAAADSDLKLSQDAQKAGRDFEAVMITQMLKTARQAGAGGWMGGSSTSSNPVLDMAEEQLARAMATQGAFGIAKLLSEAVSSRAEGQPADEPQSASIPVEES